MTTSSGKGRVLVTGASGFVGSHWVDHLVEEGCEVVATSRRRPGYLAREKFRGVRWIEADVTRPDTLPPLLEGVECVYHAAALFDFFARERDLMRVNADGTENLCRAARRAGVRRFVNVSSGAIYGKLYENRLCREADPPRPSDKYAQSKWEQEQRVFAHQGKDGFLAVSLRPGAIYGPGSRYGDAKALYLLKRGILFGRPGLKEVLSSHVHVRDVVRAARFLADRPETWVQNPMDPSDLAYNVCDQTPTFNGELLSRASELLPDKGLLGYWNVRIPAWVLKVSAWFVEAGARLIRVRPLFEVDSIDYITCGHGLTNERLTATGFRFLYPDLLAGLGETIAWYERTGWAVFRRGGSDAGGVDLEPEGA